MATNRCPLVLGEMYPLFRLLLAMFAKYLIIALSASIISLMALKYCLLFGRLWYSRSRSMLRLGSVCMNG